MATDLQAQSLEPLYDLDEAARHIHKSHWFLRREIKAGRIRCLRVGGQILIEHSELVRLLDAARQTPNPQEHAATTGKQEIVD